MIESLHERRREFNYNYLGGKPEMLSNELGQKKGDIVIVGLLVKYF